jgi:hypothetical protein
VLQAHSPTVKETMGWYGKLIGAVLGAIIGRGLLGAIVGFVIGHQFDRKAGRTSRAARPGAVPSRDLQTLFFRATFQVMGHVAKADGRITEKEIEAARAAMRRFSLSDADVQRAIGLFTEGKSPDFELEDTLEAFRDHGETARTVDAELDGADAHLAALAIKQAQGDLIANVAFDPNLVFRFLIYGDFDLDGDSDQVDFGLLQRCLQRRYQSISRQHSQQDQEGVDHSPRVAMKQGQLVPCCP